MPKIQMFNEQHLATAFDHFQHSKASLLNADRTNDYEGRKIVAFGMPFTTADYTNQGTNKGPTAVRAMCDYYTPGMYPYPSHYNLEHIADGGNLLPENRLDTATNCLLSLREQVKSEMARGNFRPVFIGGDHTLPYATLAGVSEYLDQPLALIHLDAHPDMANADEIGQGSWVYDLAKSKHIDPTRSFHLYLRDDCHTQYDNSDIVDQLCIWDTYKMKAEYRQHAFDRLVAEIKARIGDHPVWLSVDIDAFDASCAPATTIPVHAGAIYEEVQMLFLKLYEAELNVYGGEVVELIPDLDVPSKITCALAARLMRDITMLSYQAALRTN